MYALNVFKRRQCGASRPEDYFQASTLELTSQRYVEVGGDY